MRRSLLLFFFNMPLNLSLNITSKDQTFVAGDVCRTLDAVKTASTERQRRLLWYWTGRVIYRVTFTISAAVAHVKETKRVPFPPTDITSYYHPAISPANHRPEGGPLWLWKSNGRIAWALLTVALLRIGQWSCEGGGTFDPSIGRESAFLIIIKYSGASVRLAVDTLPRVGQLALCFESACSSSSLIFKLIIIIYIFDPATNVISNVTPDFFFVFFAYIHFPFKMWTFLGIASFTYLYKKFDTVSSLAPTELLLAAALLLVLGLLLSYVRYFQVSQVVRLPLSFLALLPVLSYFIPKTPALASTDRAEKVSNETVHLGCPHFFCWVQLHKNTFSVVEIKCLRLKPFRHM